jgi:colicin import membrane protein
MKLLDTIHKRKSATITTIIMLLLLLAILFLGMKYLDPPIESGIAVNFGTSEMGSGNIQPSEPVKSQVQPEVAEQEQVTEETIEESVPDDALAEDVLTQESEESIKIKKAATERLKAKAESDKKAKAEAEAIRKAEAEAEKIRKDQDEKKRKLDALMGGIKNSEGTTTGGQGNDNVGGDKGNENGDPNADGYYGNGGSGRSGDYQLGTRKPLNKPKPTYDCEEQGLVIVAIQVNRAGKVIRATSGIKGSTNMAICLVSRAKEAALKTTWQPDSNAGSTQTGIIKYRFSLSK